MQVGDKVYVIGRAYRRDQVPSKTWETVTKVGRKYFYIKEGHGAAKFALMDESGKADEVLDTNYKMTAYLTKEAYDDNIEYANLYAAVKDFFRGYYSNREIPLADLRAIATILKIKD